MTESSAQLEREAERRRADLSATLDELRSRITPGQLVDQTLDYAREGNVGEFVRNLGRDARDNPLPLVLIGAGIVWLLAASGRRSTPAEASGTTGDAMARARGAASEFADQASDSAHRLGDSASRAASNAGEKARETMAEASDWVSSTAASASERMSAAYRDASEAASGMARRFSASTSSGRSFFDFVRNEPLVLAGIGLALGGIIGAMLPATRAENRLAEETSDEIRQRTQDLAAEQADYAGSVAQSGYAAAGNEAERRGLDGMYPVAEGAESSVVPAAPGEPPAR